MMDAATTMWFFLIFMWSQAINGQIHVPSINREQSNEIAFANFKKYPFHALLAKILKTMYADDLFDCASFCLATKKCVSFNIQAEPEHSRRYHCELLETDLFRSPHKFQGNGTFHHHSVQTPCMEQNPCKNEGTCLPDYQTNSFRCDCKQSYFGSNCDFKHFHPNCAEYHKSGDSANGIRTIKPYNLEPFDVFCDQTTAEGGWTVFQKRLDGSVDFYRGWADYKHGFGNLSGEFWLGLDKIHRLTNQTNSTLWVDLEDFDNQTTYAKYDMFAVSSEASKYQLSLGNYSGTAGDSLSDHHGMAFTTKDQDNDIGEPRNCAIRYKGAWWYNDCHESNLNGLYLSGQHKSHAVGVNWRHWRGQFYSVKRAEMKFRPVSF